MPLHKYPSKNGSKYKDDACGNYKAQYDGLRCIATFLP